MLGISLKTLYNRLAVYNMNKDEDISDSEENGDDGDGDADHNVHA